MSRVILHVRKNEIIAFGLTLLSFILSLYFYPQMPENMAFHWDTSGQVDGYTSKLLGLFLIPLALVGLALLFVAIPKIDPLKENIKKFRKYYDGFVILFFTFMFSVHLFIVLWNLGVKMNPNVIIPIGLGLLFFYSGVLCENARRNWFIGIRTPWTLSSEKVWKKTHEIGGKLFKVAGMITLVGTFFPGYALFFILVPALSVVTYVIIYSYVEYQKEGR
ncbi:MAG: SdpI family protein [Candidatus Freyarchaeota archaeon]